MKALHEVTKNSDYPNHTYLTNDKKDRIFAYRCSLDNSIKVFSKPLMFSRRNRRFQTIKDQELVDSYLQSQ